MDNLKKSAVLDLWGILFHRFGVAAKAEPCEPKNTLSRQLWRNGRLRVKLKFNEVNYSNIAAKVFLFLEHVVYVRRLNIKFTTLLDFEKSSSSP